MYVQCTHAPHTHRLLAEVSMLLDYQYLGCGGNYQVAMVMVGLLRRCMLVVCQSRHLTCCEEKQFIHTHVVVVDCDMSSLSHYVQYVCMHVCTYVRTCVHLDTTTLPSPLMSSTFLCATGTHGPISLTSTSEQVSMDKQ